MQALLPAIPIVMLTALNTEVDVVLGLEIGAADYLTKPYRYRELIARIEVVLRRVSRPRFLPTNLTSRKQTRPSARTRFMSDLSPSISPAARCVCMDVLCTCRVGSSTCWR